MALFRSMVGTAGLRFATATVALSTADPTTVNLDFEPKYLVIEQGTTVLTFYNADDPTNPVTYTTNGKQTVTLPNSSSNRLNSVSSSGFVYGKAASADNITYYAFG